MASGYFTYKFCTSILCLHYPYEPPYTPCALFSEIPNVSKIIDLTYNIIQLCFMLYILVLDVIHVVSNSNVLIFVSNCQNALIVQF